MRTRTGLAFAPLIAVALVGTARAAPAWCSGTGGDKVDYNDGDLEKIESITDPLDVLPTIVGAECFPDGDARTYAKQIESARQAWSKRLQIEDADWADIAAWATAGQGERNSPTLSARDYKTPWSQWTPVDQYIGILNSTMGTSNSVSDPQYVTDALGDKLTEAGRVAYIDTCIGHPLRSNEVQVVSWAACASDIAALDRKKLNLELRTDKTADGYKRTVVRLAAYKVAQALPAHDAEVKALMAKDPGYAQIFKIADQVRKDWSKVDPRLVALMASVDDARITNSRKAGQACLAPTWEAMKAQIAAIPAKTYAQVNDDIANPFLQQAMARVIGTPNGYLAGLAFYLCSAMNEQHDYAVRSLGQVLHRWPGFRGPRNAIHTAVLAAGITLDDRDARIQYPDLSRPWIDESGSSGGGGRGAVQSVKASGDTATVTFTKIHSKERQCSKGHYTNRVTQIRSDGGLVYEYVCTATKIVTFDEPPAPPQKVNARYVGTLKKGNFADIVEDVVVAVYAKDRSGAPIQLLGVKVK
jgi:hypothetical protein